MRNSFFLGTILPKAGYTDAFRRAVADYAVMTGSYKRAANAYGVAIGSAWRWVKAFGLSQDYNMKYQRTYTDTPFIREVYPSQFRRAVAQYALKTSTKEAAKLYSVSQGSVDNWVKAWQANNAYLNR